MCRATQRAVIVLLIGLIASAGFGQTPAVPSWTPPEPSEIKSYVSSSIHSFTADFVGDPEVSEGRGSMSTYTVRRGGSLMWVRVIHFSKDDIAKVPMSEVTGKVKTAHGTTLGFNVIDLVKEGPDLIEFSATSGRTLRRVRGIVVGEKLYELYIDIPHWDSLKKTDPARADAFDREARRFFSSFRLNK